MTTDQYHQQLAYVVATSDCSYARTMAKHFLLNVPLSDAFSILSGMVSFLSEERLGTYIEFLRALADAQEALARLEILRGATADG